MISSMAPMDWLKLGAVVLGVVLLIYGMNIHKGGGSGKGNSSGSSSSNSSSNNTTPPASS